MYPPKNSDRGLDKITRGLNLSEQEEADLKQAFSDGTALNYYRRNRFYC